MINHLPIGIAALLSGAVETARLEFKASWDPTTTGPQVLKTLCAFGNDLQNLNGGYILIGVAEQNGAAVRPVSGLKDEEVDAAQKWIRGNANRIDPVYMPVIDVAEVDGKRVLVLWAPASEVRPHQAPDGPKGDRKYWVRVGSESLEAKGELLTSLMQQTARVPYDDRRGHDTTNEDLSITLVREFLKDVGSDLLHELDAERVYRSMQIVTRTNGHTVPKNIGLLFFANEPTQWFRGARIEVVEFPDDAGGNVLTEKVFRGPLHEQIRHCMAYLESLTSRHLEKRGDSLETRGWLSFPIPALREAVVNAVYHRSYEGSVEPTKVYLYPDRIEVISYPGPVPGIDLSHLQGTAVPPPVPARNRRIGELLKELRLAESRGTGLSKIRRSMTENGSSAPTFEFDLARTYFRVTLPAHPEYVTLTLLRDYAYKKATGREGEARRLLEQAWNEGLHSPSLAVALVRELVEQRDLPAADLLVDSLAQAEAASCARALTTLASAHADARNESRSRDLLGRLPELLSAQDAFDAAILERRLGRQDRAHQLFERAGELVLRDVRALHEFSQTKLRIADDLKRSKRPADQQVRKRLLTEAAGYLERVVHMAAPPTRHAWAWFGLGNARRELQAPMKDVIDAYEKACAILPNEERFKRALAQVKSKEAGT
ncbi:MAG: ATP-binding protein [Kofleriaceae bacterium]